MNSVKSERIVVARSAAGNGAATPSHVSISAAAGLNQLDARVSVAPVGRAGASEPLEARESKPADALAAADAAASLGILRQGRDPRELEAAEQRRWLMWLSPPFMLQALSVGLVFGTGKEWCLALGVASIFATVLLLIRLILGSDTNALLESATPDLIGLSDAVAGAAGLVGAPR